MERLPSKETKMISSKMYRFQNNESFMNIHKITDFQAIPRNHSASMSMRIAISAHIDPSIITPHQNNSK